MSKTIRIGFSPCPNDTFIFDALVHGKIDTEGFDFEPYLADVEELNQKALKGELEVTKLSYHAFAYAANHYRLLTAGSALGRNCGPLLISKREIKPEAGQLNPLKIAIPGKYTTANFLLGIAVPQAQDKMEMLFSEIENAVLNDEVDAGLIIHENRFTYQDKGLKKIIDLGEYWEELTGLPIPLGGIAVNRKLPEGDQMAIDQLLKKSVEFAFAHPRESMVYVRQHAQEMEEEVMKKHIGLYVNNFSVELGAEGKKAVNYLFEKAGQEGIIPEMPENIFVR